MSRHAPCLAAALILLGSRGVSASECSSWAQIVPSSSNLNFVYVAPVFDSARRRLVFFSGDWVSTKTWALELDATPPTWSEVATVGTPPPPRSEFAAVYDSQRDRMVIYAGYNGQRLNDVWALSFSTPSGIPTWAPLAPGGTGPSEGPSGHTAIYDPVGDRMVIFGGNVLTGGGIAYPSDVWAISFSAGPTWELLAQAGSGPDGRVGVRGIYDPQAARFIVYGGGQYGSGHWYFYPEAWAVSLSSGQWTNLTPVGPMPPPRINPSAILDPVHNQMIIYGGGGEPCNEDCWSLSLGQSPAWSQIIIDGPSPGRRVGHGAVYDRERMIVAGGYDCSAWPNDVWALDWRQMASFQPHTDFGPQSGPVSVAVGDLNGDGNLDVIAGNSRSPTISVLLGDGNGALGAATDFTTGADATNAVAIADLDGDGKLDVVAGCGTGNTNLVAVLLGRGDGTFMPPATYPAPPNPFSVAIGDLNRDGSPDIVAAGSYTGVWVFLGDGQGGFGAGAQISELGLGSIALADLNDDGKLDLVSVANSNPSGVARVRLGMGDGTFGAAAEFGVGHVPTSVAVADLNGDTKLDLAVANGIPSNTVSVLLGNGYGSFEARGEFAAGEHTSAVAVGDVNGDGIPDLSVTNEDASTVSVLIGHGDGTFCPKSDLATGGGPTAVAVADLSRDGRPDLVVTNQSLPSNAVSVLLNASPGAFPIETPLQLRASLACPSSVRLTWQGNSANETSFEIQMQQGVPAGPWATVATVAANTTMWTSAPLSTANQPYSWRVRACGPGGCSDWAGPVSLPLPEPLQAPTLSVTNLGTGHALKLSWSDVPGATGYEVQRSDGFGRSQVATEYADTGLTLRTPYTYYVTAVGACGPGPSSAPVTRAPDYYPVLLVHGFHGSEGTFSDCGKIHAAFPCDGVEAQKLGDALYQSGFQRIYVVEYSLLASLAEAAKTVRDRIDELCPAGSGEKVTLVAHSQGGLVCRHVIQEMGYSSRVDKLVMLATPNHGTDLALYKYLVDYAERKVPPAWSLLLRLVFELNGRKQVEDLIPGSAFLNHLNYGLSGAFDLPWVCASRSSEQLGGPTQYWLIHGTGGWCFNAATSFTLHDLYAPLFSPVTEGSLCSPNDGVVETARETDGDLVALPAYYKRNDVALDTQNPRILASHFDASAGTCPNVKAILRHPAIISFVHQILCGAVPPRAEGPLAGGDEAPEHSLDVGPDPEPETPVRELCLAQGELATGITRHDELEIDAVREARFVQSGTIGNMSFEIWSPSGRRITSADTTAGDVTFLVEPQLNLQAFVVKAPEPGPWQAISGGPEQTYAVEVLAVTDTTIKAEVDMSGGLSQSFVRCWMDGGAGPLAGASIVGTEIRPDSTTAELQFLDDGAHGDGGAGDGVFGTNADLTAAGAHVFSMRGALSSGLGPISRNALAISVTEALADLGLDEQDVTVFDASQGNDSLIVSVRVSNGGTRDAEGVMLGFREIGGSSITSPAPFDVAAGGEAVVMARWLPAHTDSTSLQVFVDRLTPVTQSRYDNDTATVVVHPSVLAVTRPAFARPLALGTPYPNPARGDVTIEYALPARAQVTLSLYDIAGRRLRTLFHGDAEAGPHVVRWNRQQEGGLRVAPGVYFYELRVDGRRLTRRVVVLR